MIRLFCGVLAVVTAIIGASPTCAKDVTLAVGLSLAPYVVPETWSGIEYDIIKEALALEGHTVTPRLMPLARVDKELKAGAVDAATPMREDGGVAGFYSDVHVSYRNYAITLASRQLRIDSIADLSGKTVVAFQGAAHYLGPDYAAMAAHNPGYREEAKQVVQPLLLFTDRTQVVIADRNIFAWFAAEPDVAGRVDTTQPITLHPIFPPTDYHVAFRDAALRDSFNRGLARLRESGEYARILARYSRYLAEDGGLHH